MAKKHQSKAAPKSEPEMVQDPVPAKSEYREHMDDGWVSKKEELDAVRDLKKSREYADLQNHPKFDKFKKGEKPE